MEILHLNRNIKLLCVQAEHFPNDIKQAFQTLINMLPTVEGRTFFGISYQSNNKEMIYQAAVSESFEGEAKHFNCSTLVIEKGDYLTERVADWKSRKASIGLTFKKLTDAAYDTTFPCIEWYQHNDVLCMIKIVIN